MLTKLKLWIEQALSIAEEVAPIVEKDAPKPRPCLPPGPHVPHEPGSVFQSRQLDPRPFLGLDHARQLEAEIMLLGLRHRPILRHRNLSERYHTQIARIDPYVNPGNSSDH